MISKIDSQQKLILQIDCLKTSISSFLVEKLIDKEHQNLKKKSKITYHSDIHHIGRDTK
jgi:hypothetical protein